MCERMSPGMWIAVVIGILAAVSAGQGHHGGHARDVSPVVYVPAQ